MNKWKILASDEVIERTVESLRKNGINALVVENGQAAKEKVLQMIPKGAEVMNMTSVTVDSIGLSKEINESGRFDSVKNKLSLMDRKTQNLEMQRIGAAPEYAVGSVHAVTEDGRIVIGSNSGSQLPGYAYGSAHVIWVVGTQKIVSDLDEGIKRVYEYVLPLEAERARKAYGVDGSNVSKILIINRENRQGRISLIFVKDILGY